MRQLSSCVRSYVVFMKWIKLWSEQIMYWISEKKKYFRESFFKRLPVGLQSQCLVGIFSKSIIV